MKIYGLVLLTLLPWFFPLSANSQSLGTADTQLSAEYKGKVFVIRGFYSGREINFAEDGTALSGQDVGSWTLANIQIGSIKVLPQSLQIKGERLGFWFTNGKTQLMKAGKLTLRIGRPNSPTDDPLVTTRKQLSRIFMNPDQNVCSDLPDYWQVYCSQNDDPKATERVWNDILAKNHLTPYNSKMKPAVASKSPITAPVVQLSPDPRYTGPAKKHHVEGATVLKLVVDEAGRPAAVTIVRPVGMGLDEEAVRCVSQTWRFRPATQDGKPVVVQINVEMNFLCCP